MTEDHIKIHKETFYQDYHSGIPAHWVVQYWEISPDGFIEAEYFETENEAVLFEKELVPYQDWYDGQEELLAVQ